MLVEARDQIMPEVPRALSEFAARELRGRGIEIRVGTTLERITDEWVTFSGGEEVARERSSGRRVRPSPVVARLGLELDQTGRIVTDSTCGSRATPNIWAIGDCAAVPDPARKGQASPPTAQHAIRQGRRLAANIAAVWAVAPCGPSATRPTGCLPSSATARPSPSPSACAGVACPAWLLARSYHLLMMPGLSRKLSLLVDWNVALLFGRDASAPSAMGRPTPSSMAIWRLCPQPRRTPRARPPGASLGRRDLGSFADDAAESARSGRILRG